MVMLSFETLTLHCFWMAVIFSWYLEEAGVNPFAGILVSTLLPATFLTSGATAAAVLTESKWNGLDSTACTTAARKPCNDKNSNKFIVGHV
jgi:hypothetical protein